ncbi:Hydrolase-4 domain-containing protein [Mycena indigotica]|uniref:Hydrolase-4 domain-containing protein n=1 Tax=Mycena indigotica TaxID=2126181 RepID=A0A8H6VUN3_9AGAR|nr:Hydrolase-4 domain-containing protein [Mycena indigotica]KAF7290733.1 Hydrolase-4 domain-containing protein [Mycena indigotica]
MGRPSVSALTLLTMALALLSVYISFSRFFFPSSIPSPRDYTYLGSDFPELWETPSREPVAMLVQESRAYPIHGPDALERWATSTSDGFGYVRLGEEKRAFAVTMFHEMHCVRLMRAALEGRYDAMSRGHMHHCLNYIRQSILCAPDLTLEPADVLTRDFEQDRIGSTHVCADWSAFFDAAADNFAAFMATTPHTNSSHTR